MDRTEPIGAREALALFEEEGAGFHDLLVRAGKVREAHKGRRVNLCAIINAKSGRCSEDCSFCAQSARYDTRIEVYPLMGAEEIVERARAAGMKGVKEFSIVTSGFRVRPEREIAEICRALEMLRDEGLVFRCASLGILTLEILARLQEAGLTKYHHNLETARSFFPRICTTHDYEEDIRTVCDAKDVGLRVCSGGIFGLGETRAQRVELAETLRDLEVDSIPINFLNPISGTPLEGRTDLTPMECLKIIAVYRLMMPDRDLYVCGGREVNLRDLQAWVFAAGANGLMVGNYLTTTGRDVEADFQMIEDLGLEPNLGEEP